MEAPLYPRSSSQKANYLLPENQSSVLDERILQLIFWTMNSCDTTHEVAHNNCPPKSTTPREYAQNLPSNLFKKENKLVDGSDPPHQLPENHRKVTHRCLHSLGPPPRPFKKARYAWEIKNYDYTVKKMTQNMTLPTTAAATTQEKQDHFSKEKLTIENLQGPEAPNFCTGPGVAQICGGAKLSHEGKPAEMHMIGPPHPGSYVGPLMPTSYHAHYGAIMGPNPNHPNPLSHGERLSSFHAQIPPDPDARLIRWHTRQLCRSIFDNTVNRMLENMGFSPVTERSQALHPLLVLSLSDDEEREAEEVHQRTLETQALSAALHQKGLLPPPYHYDPLESATTSDYDSSEEDSELGEGGPDELSGEQPNLPLPPPPPPQIGDEEAYLSLNSQHPSLAHIVNKPLPYLAPHLPLLPLNQNQSEPCDQRCTPAQALCDYRNNCDASDSLIPSCTERKESSETLPNTETQTSQHVDSSPKEYQADLISRCPSLECSKEHSETENSLEKKLKVDDNENCIAPSPKSETLIEGKVERVLDAHHPSEISLEGTELSKARESDNNNDSYFIRNSIHMAIKQQGLGFQRA